MIVLFSCVIVFLCYCVQLCVSVLGYGCCTGVVLVVAINVVGSPWRQLMRLSRVNSLTNISLLV